LAFDENSAADGEEAKINYKAILDSIEKNALINRTRESKIFMTKTLGLRRSRIKKAALLAFLLKTTNYKTT
jgi:hypothetical protein